jgi:hypothetical protein
MRTRPLRLSDNLSALEVAGVTTRSKFKAHSAVLLWGLQPIQMGL